MHRARALASRVHKLAHQSAEYAASAAPRARLSSAAARVKDAYGVYSSSASGGAWGEEEEVLTTPKKAMRRRQLVGGEAELGAVGGSSRDMARSVSGGGGGSSTPPALASPAAEKSSSKWGGWGGYFSSGGQGEEQMTREGSTGGGAGGKLKIGAEDVEEDKWATLSPSHSPITEPALVLSIQTHGYAYRQRPLSSASRSQRIFYALAKSFAALPKLPSTSSAAAVGAVGVESMSRAGSLDSISATLLRQETARAGGAEGSEVFEQLLDIGGREGTPGEAGELVEATREVVQGKEPRERTVTEMSDEPEEMSVEERMRSPTAASFPSSSVLATHPHDPTHPPQHASTAPPSSAISPPTSPLSSSPEDLKILPNAPTKLNRRPHVRIEIPAKRAGGGFAGAGVRSPSLPTSPSSPAPGQRTPGTSGRHSVASSVASSRASSRANSPTRSSRSSRSSRANTSSSGDIPPESWPAPFPPVPFPTSSLHAFHTNLHTRLLPFLGLKLPLRKIRLSVFPVLPAGQLFDGPLARKIVSTSAPGGGWKAALRVEGRELRRWLEATGGAELKVRVVAELLEPEGASATDSFPSTGGGGGGEGGGGWESGAGIGSSASFPSFPSSSLEGDPLQGQGRNGKGLAGWETRATAVAEDECELGVGIQGEGGEGGGVRVVSDVDDTIKWTEVLKGTKTIFRNCFVRELHEIRVPGMASWYRHLSTAHSVQFHYVSNSPWELFPVIRSFLRVAGFPSGSVTLKEYGGAASTLAKLWEEPGARKRANVEGVMREFPGAKFILVGDSGEQDLQLYASLAAQYPEQVIAIYIRDVTTPFTPPSHSSSLNSNSNSNATPTVEWHHAISEADLASLVRDEELAAGMERLETAQPREREDSSDLPDLPGQYHSSHERHPPHHAATLPPSTSTATSNLPYKPYEPKKKLRKPPPPPIPARPSLGGRTLSKSSLFGGRKSQPSTPTSSRPASPTSFPSDDSAPPTPISRSSPASSRRSTTDPSALYDDSGDPLSPNNPLRPSLPPPPPAAAVEAWWRRVAEAQRVIPKGCVLRIFRGGEEVREECAEIVRKATRRG
ncbi:hypothetical protein JCM10213v2_005445 [Rhodosporidiobolus nylandii]